MITGHFFDRLYVVAVRVVEASRHHVEVDSYGNEISEEKKADEMKGASKEERCEATLFHHCGSAFRHVSSTFWLKTSSVFVACHPLLGRYLSPFRQSSSMFGSRCGQIFQQVTENIRRH